MIPPGVLPNPEAPSNESPPLGGLAVVEPAADQGAPPGTRGNGNRSRSRASNPEGPAMDSAQPRLRRRRPWLLAAAVALGVSGLVALLVSASVDETWRRIGAYAHASKLEWEARDFQRTPLWGDSFSGSASEHYRQAQERATALAQEDGELLIALLQGRDDVPAPQRAAFRTRWAPVLAALHAGAHRTDARPGVRPELGFNNRTQSLLHSRNIVNAALIEASTLLREGHDVEAVQVSLDAATFGADRMRSPLVVDKMVGTALVTIATHQAWPDEALRELGGPALNLLAEGLARLDALLPRTVAREEELMLLAHHLLDGPEVLHPEHPARWRHAFSSRWMIADTFERLAQASAELQGSESLPWPEREAQIDYAEARLQCHPNAAGLAKWGSVERSLRLNLARVRLLRLAVDAHLGRDPGPLVDPLGTSLLAAHTTDSGRRFTSEAPVRDGHLMRDATLR